MPRPLHVAGLALLLSGCGADRAPREILRDRPPAPLDSMPLASDARLDSAGFLAGSFVGEGTERAVHLLSSDTALIAALDRREARVHRAMVGSPLGHTEVTVAAIRLHQSGCARRGPQAEIIVEDHPAPGDPPLRGPVLGSFLSTGAPAGGRPGLVQRPRPPAPSPSLTESLIDRTRRDLDSRLAARHPGLALRPLPPPIKGAGRVEVNTLADLDAADVIAVRVGGGRLRYAVSLRERRLSGGDTLVAAGVTVWDSGGAWRQPIFRPTLLRVSGDRLEPYAGESGKGESRPLYWRRLQPIADVAYPRDDVWMEQVDVRTGRVVWGVVQPEENVVIAAAEVGGCN